MSDRFRWSLAALAVGALAAVLLTAFHLAGRADRELKYVEQGEASWYGPGFHGKKTASGARYHSNDLTAAHRKLPLGSEATITNLEDGKQVEVEINDRGPYAAGRKLIFPRPRPRSWIFWMTGPLRSASRRRKNNSSRAPTVAKRPPSKVHESLHARSVRARWPKLARGRRSIGSAGLIFP